MGLFKKKYSKFFRHYEKDVQFIILSQLHQLAIARLKALFQM